MKKISGILAITVTLLLAIGCGTQKEIDYSTGQAIQPDLTEYFGKSAYMPDIETFMQIGYGASPSISPNGNRMFFESHMTGVTQLFRIDNGWPYQLTMFQEGIDWHSLSNSGDLAIIGSDAGGSENAQMLLLDTHTGRIRQLTDQSSARFGGVIWSNDDKSIFFYSNKDSNRDFKLYKMTLADGNMEMIVDVPGYNGWAAKSLDEKKMIYYTFTSNVNADLYLLDIATGDVEHLTEHEGEILYDNVYFSANGKYLYLTCNDNPKGMNWLAKLDLATKEITYLDENAQWDVEGVNMADDRKVMGWTINENGYARLKLRDMESGRDLPVPGMNGMESSPSFSNSSKLLFTFNSPTKTTDVWSWDWNTQKLKQVTFSTYAGIDRTHFLEPELIKYKSFDGLEIPAFIYLPPNYKEGEPVPFILHIHGGPEGQFRPSFARHFQYLMLHGFGILAPNVRGSDGYGTEYLSLDNYKNRLKSVKDMKAGADWLIEQGYSVQGRIGVKGGSYGGYMAMAAITEYPGFFAASMNSVGIVNFVSFLENTADYRRALRESEYGPLSDPEFLKSISPIHKANLITTPLLIVHGENDPRVPVGEARQIIKALKKRNIAVEALIFPDEGHGVSQRKNSLQVYRKMADFFEKHLKK
ncbi:MAG: S9 family peptidase [candidate division Zixibacteria bacterium]|nr:S9 family peptidase [candidate division Zixibacteria bacterium]